MPNPEQSKNLHDNEAINEIKQDFKNSFDNQKLSNELNNFLNKISNNDFQETNDFIGFMQWSLIQITKESPDMDKFRDNKFQDLYPNAMKIIKSYSGYCDLICNYLTMTDALSDSKTAELTLKNLQINYKSYYSDIYYDKNKYQPESDQYDESLKPRFQIMEDLSKTHLLLITKLFEKILYFLSGRYPNSIVKPNELSKILNKDNTINQDILQQSLDKCEPGSYIKFCTIRESGKLIKTPTGGHSMLIYKQKDGKFSFFDPDGGLSRNLDFSSLATKINEATQNTKKICLIDNKKFLSRAPKKIQAKYKTQSPSIGI